MTIRGLNDAPSIYQYEKTVIKKGVIVKQKIWKDTNGNELEKVGSKFMLKKNRHQHLLDLKPEFLQNLLQSYSYQTQKQDLSMSSDENNVLDIILLFCIFFLILTVFFLGYVFGVGVVKHHRQSSGIDGLHTMITVPPEYTEM